MQDFTATEKAEWLPLEAVHGDKHKGMEEQKVNGMKDQHQLRKVMEEEEEQNEIDKEDQKDMTRDMVEHEEQQEIDQEDQKQMEKAKEPAKTQDLELGKDDSPAKAEEPAKIEESAKTEKAVKTHAQMMQISVKTLTRNTRR